MESKDIILHERDVALRLGLSIAWLQKARYLGQGPRFVKVGGPSGRAVRYRESDIAEYISQNIVETNDTRGN